MRDVHELLVDARNYFDKVGHWKERCEGSPLGTCPVIAISFARGENYTLAAIQTSKDAQSIFAEKAGLRSRFDIPDWNDHRKTTKQMVLDAFDAAIAETAPPPMVPFVEGEFLCAV